MAHTVLEMLGFQDDSDPDVPSTAAARLRVEPFTVEKAPAR